MPKAARLALPFLPRPQVENIEGAFCFGFRDGRMERSLEERPGKIQRPSLGIRTEWLTRCYAEPFIVERQLCGLTKIELRVPRKAGTGLGCRNGELSRISIRNILRSPIRDHDVARAIRKGLHIKHKTRSFLRTGPRNLALGKTTLDDVARLWRRKIHF